VAVLEETGGKMAPAFVGVTVVNRVEGRGFAGVTRESPRGLRVHPTREKAAWGKRTNTDEHGQTRTE
jgi:hypothetical protein